MRIGYPCINRRIGCTANSTFRLNSYSKERVRLAVSNNLDCLFKILKWNSENDLRFFRISSDIVPFASHPVMDVRWTHEFKKELKLVGHLVRQENMRISMHPDQFVLLNALDKGIVQRSIAELRYHAEVLDAMGIEDAAIQIHVGGMYGNKAGAMDRFINTYRRLPANVKKRLAIENDERLYSLADCLAIHERTKIPVIFDSFHNELNGRMPLKEAMNKASATWGRMPLMMDYSSQEKGKRPGTHAEHIDNGHFRKFLKEAKGDFDLMLEIKDKEKSAVQALRIAKEMGWL